ncbi:PA0069 family radical SAM protein [Nguyenibacter sp. L1]|uniref:PA0069 family radical SAM protein n=1 Tax=Nguyenibacter sp. L1 TaxID=3049350 RepID=UPI002B4719AF|nr:PA0069 family radical SAM protein [Nguyenibacter sp. L1]WRH88050.1 PA0069 family radical SAM protein [Nguyenibacter sp. L1]
MSDHAPIRIGRGQKTRAAPHALDARSTGLAGIRHGRGATISPPDRHAAQHGTPVDDGWGSLAEADPVGESKGPRTELSFETPRSIITRNTSPDLGFDRSINAYRGCEHGCIYCYARPTHAWVGLSPGLDFETRLTCKPEAARLLERELRRPAYQVRPIALGPNTDPYQPVERDQAITRSILAVLERFSHPVTIVTKSAGILRDIDILRALAERDLVQVSLSVTTLDPELARRMEPRAAAPARRLEAMAALARAGIPTSVMAAPMIPALNDHELEAILKEAAAVGACNAAYVLLRLPLEVAPLFEDWLHRHYPDRAQHVLRRVRETRGGALYDSTFGLRGRGQGVQADLLRQRFLRARRALGLERGVALDCTRFAPPPAQGEDAQLALF